MAKWPNYLVAAAFVGAALGQEEPVFRVTTGLVQVDAVVIDKSGRVVTDLGQDDFEILQDGKKRAITRFSFVAADTPAPGQPAPRALVPGPAGLTRAQVRRTIVVLVDDLGLSFRSMSEVREGLRRFLREHTAQGDLIAIMRTAQGSGAHQSFTTDRAQLLAAVDTLRWDFRSRSGDSAFEDLDGQGLPGRTDSQNDVQARAQAGKEQVDQLRADYFAVGTLGALDYIVRGLREMPGRKSVVVMSEGFVLRRQGFDRMEVKQADGTGTGATAETAAAGPLRRLGEAAARAGVVLYSIDPRGVIHTGATAADHVSSGMDIAAVTRMRGEQVVATREPLQYLARETGGLFLADANGVTGLLRRVMDDQAGYYLLGYEPGEASFNRAFHRIQVKVKRPGLQVRGRAGFFGIADTPPAPPRRLEPGLALVRALQSPFLATDIPVRMSGIFAVDTAVGPVVNCLLHVDASALRLTRGEDGVERGVLDVLVAGYGHDGAVADRSANSYTVELKPEDAAKVRASGISYHVKYPVKKPGAYQLRAVVMERDSQRAGSASRFLMTPDIARDRMALSGILLDGKDADAVSFAAREFHPGDSVQWGLQVVNAAIDPATNRPALSLRIRLFKDGARMFEGAPSAVSAPEPTGRIAFVSNSLRLSKKMPPGEYVLELEFTDNARKRPVIESEWAGFRVVP